MGVTVSLIGPIQCRYVQSESWVLEPSVCNIQHSLDQFAVCEAAGINSFKSESVVLSRITMDCPVRIGDEFFSQVKEFKYLGVLFKSEENMEWEIGQRIGFPVSLHYYSHLWS